VGTPARPYSSIAKAGGTVEDLNALAASGKGFAVSLADPRWEFQTYRRKGKRHSAERCYDTMPLDDIKALPIDQLAGEDCAVVLVGLLGRDAGRARRDPSMGFEFKSLGFNWIKQNPERALPHPAPGAATARPGRGEQQWRGQRSASVEAEGPGECARADFTAGSGQFRALSPVPSMRGPGHFRDTVQRLGC
jgi:hypothetical protein